MRLPLIVTLKSRSSCGVGIKNWEGIGANSTTIDLHLENCIVLHRLRKKPNFTGLKGDPYLREMGWVDLYFDYSTVSSILPGLMGISRLG